MFEWDDLSEEALCDVDKCLRQRRNAYEQMKTEMAILSHFVESNKAGSTNLSPRYHHFGCQHAKEPERRTQRRERRKKAGTSSSQNIGSGDNSTIYKDEGSTEEEDDNTESNKAKDKFADSVIAGSGDFFMSSPNDNHEGDIESAMGGGGAEYKECIGRDGLLSLIPHNCFVYSSKECWDTILVVHFKSFVSSWERQEDNWILKIFVKIQEADLWRFNKHKMRATLGMGEYLPVMTCTLFCGTQGIEVWMGKHPLPSCAVHKWSYRIVLPDLLLYDSILGTFIVWD